MFLIKNTNKFYLLSSSVVVYFRHGAKGRSEFVHGWSGWVGLTRKGTI